MEKTKVLATQAFLKSAKPLLKRYKSLEGELETLISKLEVEPETGTPLGDNLFKIRLAIKSKQKGKRGGARLITFYLKKDDALFLLTIFDKSEKENVSDGEIKKWINELF